MQRRQAGFWRSHLTRRCLHGQQEPSTVRRRLGWLLPDDSGGDIRVHDAVGIAAREQWGERASRCAEKVGLWGQTPGEEMKTHEAGIESMHRGERPRSFALHSGPLGNARQDRLAAACARHSQWARLCSGPRRARLLWPVLVGALDSSVV